MNDQIFIILLVLEVVITLALIGLVLMQPSDGSLGGLSGGSNPLAQNQSTTGKRSNPFEKATIWTAVAFFVVSILLAFYSGALNRTTQTPLVPISEIIADPDAPIPTDNAPEDF